jgi:glycosyltransferase involved in cell wall biosynthesis
MTAANAAELLSVIIPCRNAARYLAAALASARSQTAPPDEIIVIDDGSTDGSADIADAIPGVRVTRQPPLGIGAARNAGLAHARGGLIAFLDADDLWPTDSLRLRLDALAADPAADGVCGAVEQFVSPDAHAVIGRPARQLPNEMTARSAGAMLLRRRVFDRIGGFDASLTLGDTLDLVARMDEAGIRIARIDNVVLRRRIHGANTVLTRRDSQRDYLKILKASLDRRRGAASV